MRLLFTFAIILTALYCSADKTTRKGLKATPKKEVTAKADSLVIISDTVMPSPGMVRLSGYDKPLRSFRESIFITNASRRTLTYVDLEITYLDEEGRMLHKRNVKLPVNIPGSETRQINFLSWDKQRNLYYTKSGKPSTSDGTPYSIKAKAVEAAYKR